MLSLEKKGKKFMEKIIKGKLKNRNDLREKLKKMFKLRLGPSKKNRTLTELLKKSGKTIGN